MLQVGRERMQQPGELPVPESEDDELLEAGRLKMTVGCRRGFTILGVPRNPGTSLPNGRHQHGGLEGGLFAEQAAAIRETQRVAIGEAVSSL